MKTSAKITSVAAYCKKFKKQIAPILCQIKKNPYKLESNLTTENMLESHQLITRGKNINRSVIDLSHKFVFAVS